MERERLEELLEAATPGPWVINPEWAAVYTPDGKCVCSTWDMGDDGDLMYGANRSLIALAPELARLCLEQHEALEWWLADEFREPGEIHLRYELDRGLLARFRDLEQHLHPEGGIQEDLERGAGGG